MRFPKCFSGDGFRNGLFHGTGPPLLSSFGRLTKIMGKAGFIASFVGILLAGAAAPPPVTTITQVLAALDRGDAQQARRLSDTALSHETLDAPMRARLLLYHGLATELLGAHDGALRDLTQAINLQALAPEDMEQAYLQRGFLREGLGQLDEAIGDYGAAIALKGYSTATAFNNRGNIYLRRNRLMDAQADYLAALAAEGGQSQYAYYGLGRVTEAMGDRLAARNFYAKAVAIDAGYAAASERLAALGGAPGAANPNPAEPIVLRPPPARNAAPALAEAPILLRPPPDKKQSASLPAVPPSPFLPVNAVALRPALDQSDVPVSAGKGRQVQLGAWRSAAEASAAWDKAKARADGLLDGLRPQVQVAEIPGRGRYFRLRVRPETGKGGAEMCAALAAKALACFPVRD
jgi:tetratricopeptide (TPR) repeat protein